MIKRVVLAAAMVLGVTACAGGEKKTEPAAQSAPAATKAAAKSDGFEGLVTPQDREAYALWCNDLPGGAAPVKGAGSEAEQSKRYAGMMERGAAASTGTVGARRLALYDAFRVACDQNLGADKVKAAGVALLGLLPTETPGASELRLRVVMRARSAGVSAEGGFSDQAVVEDCTRMAEERYRAGKLAQALTAAETAVDWAKKVEAKYGLVLAGPAVLRKTIQEEMAVDAVLKDAPDSWPANRSKGVLLLARGAETEAAAHLNKSGQLEWHRLGMALGNRRTVAERMTLAEALTVCLASATDKEKPVLAKALAAETKTVLATPELPVETKARAESLAAAAGKELAAIAAKDRSVADAAGGPVTFFGSNSESVTRVAFVLDHSGSMLDSFDFLRQEARRSIGKLTAVQKFAVVMYSESVDHVFPRSGEWSPASGEAKRDVDNWLDNIKAQGENDDLFDPFTAALKKALSMNPPPQVIYFLTDGNFDPRVVGEVSRLNRGKHAVINTVAFVKISREAEENLKTLAKENGGRYKFVGEKNLGEGN